MKNIKFKNNNRNNNGFTLVELILAISLVALVIGISSNLLIFGNKTQKITFNQYDIQSSVRITSEKLNNIIRYSKAIFSVPEKYIERTSKMDPQWSYLMVSHDGKRIVDMNYNSSTKKHEENILVDEQEDIRFRLVFEKEEGNSDKMMKYYIYAYIVDENEVLKHEELVYESSVEAINTIQVVDKSILSYPSIALAYKEEGKSGGDQGESALSYVTLILDISGSMDSDPDGEEASDDNPSRISLLKDTLLKNQGLIDKLSQENGVYLSIIPFNNTANYSNPYASTSSNSYHPILSTLKNNDDIINDIQKLDARGPTNTGDGLRRAYHLHKKFPNNENFEDDELKISNETEIKHYTILLIDGETNRSPNKVSQEFIGINRYGYYGDYFTYNEPGWYMKETPYTGDGNLKFRESGPRRREYRDFKIATKEITGDLTYYDHRFEKEMTKSGNFKIAHYDLQKIKEYPIMLESMNSPDDYIKVIGNLIKKDLKLNSYIIAYASKLTDQINLLGEAIGTPKDKRYLYDDEDFDLEVIFNNITNDILAERWLIIGPQIME